MRWKILICDDEESTCSVLKSMIQKQFKDCYIETVYNAEECIIRGNIIVPHIAIIDIHLPDMSGQEVCIKLRNDILTQQTAILMITGAVDNGEAKLQSLEAGADAFLYKPIEYAQFISQIKILMRCKIAEDEVRHRACRKDGNLKNLRILTHQLCKSTAIIQKG